MVNIGKILKRSWQIVWRYRVLWIFGLLLALTMGGNGPSNNGSSNYQTPAPQTNNRIPPVMPENAPEWLRQLPQWFTQNVNPLFERPMEHIGTFVSIAAIVILIALFIGGLLAFVRYPAESAVMRMVDEYERSGSKLGFARGWKLGWTRRAFRLWLIDLILAIPALVFVLLILGAGLIVYFSVSSTFQVTNALGVVAAIGLGFVSLFFLVVTAVFLSLLRHFMARAAVLDGLEVSEALRQGWAMFKRNWKSAGLMWLVMIGISFLFGIAMWVVLILFIPAYLVLLIPAALVAVLPGLIGYGITSLFTSGPLLWVITAVATLPFFFIVLFAPLFLVGGWYKLYESNVWTLTYREIKALESLAAPASPAAGPAPIAPAAEA